MNKIVILIVASLMMVSCASRTFHVSTEPITAKIYYQTFKTAKFKGYAPVSFTVDKDDIGPSSKVVVETDGYKRKEVNVGGFDGTDIYLMVKLEEEMASQFIKPEIDSADDALQATAETGPKIDQPIPSQAGAPPQEPKKIVEDASETKVDPTSDQSDAHQEQSSDNQDTGIKNQTEQAGENKPAQADKTTAKPETIEGLKLLNDQLRKELEELRAGGTPGISGELDVKSVNRAMQHIMRAQRFIQLTKLDEALVETFKALAINDKLSTAFALQGSIYYMKKDFPSCMSAWQQAFILDPSNMEVYEMLKFMKSKFGQ